MITNYLKQIRLVHWIKNILIFFPIIITSEINKIDYKIIYAFLSFSFLCSFFYCLNDLNDFKEDRNHILKAKRPFASKKITKFELFFLIVICFFLSVAFYIKTESEVIFKFYVIYFFLNFLYNLIIKKIKYLDIFYLQLFYYIRIAIGASIYSIELSEWIIFTFTLFFFHLSILKRYHEVIKINKNIKFKNYYTSDLKVFDKILFFNFLTFLVSNFFYFQSTNSKFLNLGITKFIILEILLCYLLYNIFRIVKKRKKNKDFFEMIISNKTNYIISIVIIIYFYFI